MENATYPMSMPALNAADLNQKFLEIVPSSPDVEQRVDDILGLALGAFDARTINEAQFCDLTAKCLDTLTHLAR